MSRSTPEASSQQPTGDMPEDVELAAMGRNSGRPAAQPDTAAATSSVPPTTTASRAAELGRQVKSALPSAAVVLLATGAGGILGGVPTFVASDRELKNARADAATPKTITITTTHTVIPTQTTAVTQTADASGRGTLPARLYVATTTRSTTPEADTPDNSK